MKLPFRDPAVKCKQIELEMERLQHWHHYFAWKPIHLGNGDWRWLETIRRKGTLVDSTWGHLDVFRWKYTAAPGFFETEFHPEEK